MKNFLAIFFMVIIFFAGCGNEQGVEVRTEKISPTDAILTIEHDGKISLSRELMIYSNVSGIVLEKYFKDGDDVTEGQKLFKIGNKDTETEILQTKVALGEAMTKLTKELAQKNPVGELQAEISKLQDRIKILEEKSAAGMIHSPITGKSGVNNLKLVENVTANETVLAKVGSDNPIAVRFEISSAEKNFLTTGTPKISLKLNDGTIYSRAGKINFLNDTTAEAIFDNPAETLILGDAVKVVLDGVKIQNALLVPENAIQQRDGENFVFAVDSNKKAVLKKILLGGKAGNQFVVTDGLKAGDSVVVEGLTNLREGTPLKLVISD